MSIPTKNHVAELMKRNSRLDGRQLTEYRQPISVEYNISKSAEGSAKVTIGETVVLAGIKMEVAKPYPDSPEEGSLMVGAELSPLASPDFETGPPSIYAIEISRVVDRGIREGKALDFRKLCIRPGELMWIAVIDICPLNDAGNLFDAGSLAALAALKAARFPKLENDIIDYKTLTDEKLPLQSLPLGVTVCKIGNNYFVDPGYEEQEAVEARLTVASLEDGTLCALQKGGDHVLSAEDIDKMTALAVEKAKELRKLL